MSNHSPDTQPAIDPKLPPQIEDWPASEGPEEEAEAVKGPETGTPSGYGQTDGR